MQSTERRYRHFSVVLEELGSFCGGSTSPPIDRGLGAARRSGLVAGCDIGSVALAAARLG